MELLSIFWLLRGCPFGLTEASVKAARKIKFISATIDGRPVSMFIQLEYNFDLYGEPSAFELIGVNSHCCLESLIFQLISDDYHYINEFRGAGHHRRGRPASGKTRGR